jgi:GT2 family glycosyltransferase
MKKTIIIPVLNEEALLPRLFSSLAPVRSCEVLLVDNGSEDSSLSLLQEFAADRRNVRLLKESRRGFAEPLNRAVAEATGELLLFLDADSQPGPGWPKAMEAALSKADLAVGKTLSALKGRPSPYGRIATQLFQGHSERAAMAKGHALPWGPTCNLGVRRSWFERIGPFSPEAAGAFDIDWCWRAVLGGARITYAPQAVVKHFRRNEREALLRQFDRYGLGEAWLHRTYSFLLGEEEEGQDPLLAGVDAFLRLRRQSQAAKEKALAAALEEVAAAFASGVRAGFERPHRECALERPRPRKAVSWWSGKKEKTIFVPGKGVTSLQGKPLQLWLAIEGGAGRGELERLFQRLFRASAEEAHHELHSFLDSLSPATY